MQASTMNSYEPVLTPHLVDATAIARMFGKPKGWFARDRVRKALYSRGFPRPVIQGRWLRTAVLDWMEQQGRRTCTSSLATTYA